MTDISRETNGGAALPRHYLKPCLLLLLAEGPSHGYELLAAEAEACASQPPRTGE